MPGKDWRVCCNCNELKPNVRPGPLCIPICRGCDNPAGHDRLLGPCGRDDEGAETLVADTDREDEPNDGRVLDVPFEGHFGPRCVECPTCGAGKGAYCKRPSGHQGPVVAFHASRQRLAGRVRLVGLACQLCGTEDRPGRYVAPILEADEDQPPVGTLACVWCADHRRAFVAPDSEKESLDDSEEE